MSVRRFGVALLLAASLALPAVAQTAPGPDRAAIEKIVREYIVANPEILVEAMAELERRQDAQRQAAAKAALVERRAELLSDPVTPPGGNPQGDVTIVEFFDYHCGYCKQVHPTVKAVVAADRNVRVVYKELPILSESSRVAALGALAAARQGKYPEMHAALMETRGEITRERLMAVARDLRLDATRLERDMADPALAARIEANLSLARALGVTGTPAFVIGNRVVPGAIDAETMRKAIADARRG